MKSINIVDTVKREEYLQKRRVANRHWRDRQKELGLCVRGCGTKTNGKVKCPECSKKDNKRYRYKNRIEKLYTKIKSLTESLQKRHEEIRKLGRLVDKQHEVIVQLREKLNAK